MSKDYDITDTTDYSKMRAIDVINQETESPDPFHLIIPHELFLAIKNNQNHTSGQKVDIATAQEFEKFKKLFKTFLDLLNRQDPGAFSVLSSIMSMWGYSRKYCGMCGKPIIGRPGHIENRMVCGQCNASFRITERLYHKDEPSSHPPRKFIPSNSQNPSRKEQSNTDKR